MYKNLKWRILLILVMVLGAVTLAYPLKEKIALGLDLQGGMHLVLEVKVEKAVEASLERLADDIKRDIGEEDLEVDRIKAIFETLQINIRMVDAVDLLLAWRTRGSNPRTQQVIAAGPSSKAAEQQG